MTGERRTPGQEPSPAVPEERRLAHPPSERYGTKPADGAGTETPRATDPDPPSAVSGGSGTSAVSAVSAVSGATPARGIAYGAIVAIAGAALIVVFGGALAVSAGLLVVASGVGYTVGLATLIGSADTLSGKGRSWLAAGLAVLGVLLGQVGLWLFARAEGGVLALIDYLAQTFGPLVPMEVVLAAVVAWWRAR